MEAASGPEQTIGPRRSVRLLPGALWVVTVVLIAAAAITSLIDPTPDQPGSPDAIFVPLFVALVTSLATVGALLALRRATNPIGWLMLAGAFLVALALAAISFERYATATGRGFAIPVPEWLSGIAFQVGLVLQVVVVLIFPDGALPHRGRSVLAIVVVGLTLSSIGGAIKPAPTDAQAPLEVLGNSLIVLGLVLAALSVVGRLRAARGDERKQLEWFSWVAAVLAVALMIAALQAGPISDVAWIVAFVAFTGLPIAIAIAIMQYRLYEIDRLVSRTLVYVPLVGILGGVYAAGTAILQRLFIQYTGDTSDAAVVMSTLIVAGTFTPVRKSLEGAVERRFSRSRAGSSDEAPASAVPALSVGPVIDLSALIDDPQLTARIEEIAARVADERMQEGPPGRA